MIKSWSFSRYADYKQCPAKAKYKHVDKLKEPPNAAMQRGTDIHKLAENYVLGKLKRLPAELKQFSEEFKRLKMEKEKAVEESWAFRADWSETVWNDWDGCWVRIKLDVAYVNHDYNVLVVIDHKTGRYKPDQQDSYAEQIELYALAGLLKFPHVDAVSPRLWYIDHGVVHPQEDELEFTHDDTERLIKLWQQRTKPMLTDKKFKPTPNFGCQWCFFSKSKGGPCVY